MKASWLAVLGLVLVASLASPAIAETPERLKAQWQADYQAILQRATDASAEYEAARRIYNKNKQNRHKRGDARKEINENLRDAQIAMARADAELADFPDLARRAGIPPGWLRDVEGSGPAAQGTAAPGS